jgi:hypothetical protein
MPRRTIALPPLPRASFRFLPKKIRWRGENRYGSAPQAPPHDQSISVGGYFDGHVVSLVGDNRSWNIKFDIPDETSESCERAFFSGSIRREEVKRPHFDWRAEKYFVFRKYENNP